MNTSGQIEAEALRIEDLYRTKARAEIAEAEALVPGEPCASPHGDELAGVLLLKGEPGAEDLARGYALAGADGVAIGKALDALGLSEARFAVCTRVGAVSDPVRIRRLRLLTEAVDPRVVIALDAIAAEDLAAAFGVPRFGVGVPARVRGRTILAIDDFEGSLASEAHKRRVWTQLKSLGA